MGKTCHHPEAPVCDDAVGGAEAAQGTAGGRDLGQHGGAVGARNDARAVSDVVDLAGDGHNALERSR